MFINIKVIWKPNSVSRFGSSDILAPYIFVFDVLFRASKYIFRMPRVEVVKRLSVREPIRESECLNIHLAKRIAETGNP